MSNNRQHIKDRLYGTSFAGKLRIFTSKMYEKQTQGAAVLHLQFIQLLLGPHVFKAANNGTIVPINMNFTQQTRVLYSKNRLQYMKIASRKTMKTTRAKYVEETHGGKLHQSLKRYQIFLLIISKSLQQSSQGNYWRSTKVKLHKYLVPVHLKQLEQEL